LTLASSLLLPRNFFFSGQFGASVALQKKPFFFSVFPELSRAVFFPAVLCWIFFRCLFEGIEMVLVTSVAGGTDFPPLVLVGSLAGVPFPHPFF